MKEREGGGSRAQDVPKLTTCSLLSGQRAGRLMQWCRMHQPSTLHEYFSQENISSRSQTLSMVHTLKKEGLVNTVQNFWALRNFGGNNLIGSLANYLVCIYIRHLDHKYLALLITPLQIYSYFQYTYVLYSSDPPLSCVYCVYCTEGLGTRLENTWNVKHAGYNTIP